MGQKLTKQDVRDAVQHAFEQTKAVTGGKNADYIPYLANVPSDLFGIAVCLPDGEIIAAGDTEYKFGIESVSKVPTAILTMNQYSPEEVLTKIGADATGLPFNSIMAILLEKDHPSTPLVNAGAIAACSMIKPIGKPDAKWEAIQGFIEGLCGSSVEVRYSGIFPSAPHLSSIPNNSEVVRPMSKPQASSDGRTSSGWRHGFPSGRVQVPSGQ